MQSHVCILHCLGVVVSIKSTSKAFVTSYVHSPPSDVKCSHTNTIAVLLIGLLRDHMQTPRSSVFLAFQTLRNTTLARRPARMAIWFAFVAELIARAGVLDKCRILHFFNKDTVHCTTTILSVPQQKSWSTSIESPFVIGVSKRTARVILHLFLTYVQRTNRSLYQRTHHEKHFAFCIQSCAPLVLVVLT